VQLLGIVSSFEVSVLINGMMTYRWSSRAYYGATLENTDIVLFFFL